VFTTSVTIASQIFRTDSPGISLTVSYVIVTFSGLIFALVTSSKFAVLNERLV
jgi:hypothetical protein